MYQLFTTLGSLQVGNGTQHKTKIELTSVAFAHAPHGSVVANMARIGSTDDLLPDLLSQFSHLAYCASRNHDHKNIMQNKKLVRIVIWVVVISMVMSLLIAALSLF